VQGLLGPLADIKIYTYPPIAMPLTQAIGVQLAPVGLWSAFVVLLRRGLRSLSVASAALTAAAAGQSRAALL
jgi:hypothetical protein